MLRFESKKGVEFCDGLTRRDFLRVLMGSALAGASVLELAYHQAAWARAAVDPGTKLFQISQQHILLEQLLTQP